VHYPELQLRQPRDLRFTARSDLFQRANHVM